MSRNFSWGDYIETGNSKDNEREKQSEKTMKKKKILGKIKREEEEEEVNLQIWKVLKKS